MGISDALPIKCMTGLGAYNSTSNTSLNQWDNPHGKNISQSNFQRDNPNTHQKYFLELLMGFEPWSLRS